MTDQPSTHPDAAGQARMVDVSGKEVSLGTATAVGLVSCRSRT